MNYPTPPVKVTESALMYAKACKELGYHPFPQPASTVSQPYINSEGLTLGGCQYCGHCERAGCEANAKAGPHVCVLPVLRADPKFDFARARGSGARKEHPMQIETLPIDTLKPYANNAHTRHVS
jgi:hypothetical protein